MSYLNSTSDAQSCSDGELTSALSFFVQALLAFIAFTSLIVKRFCEPYPERRPWLIWFFDTSKQAIGAAVIHFANVFLAGAFRGDPCTWYFISFLLDSSLGLFVIYIGLRVSQKIAQRKDCTILTFGEYGYPPKCNAWLAQCGVYILVMLIEKIIMTLLVMFHFWKKVKIFIMKPIHNHDLELVIVMFIVPFIVNAFIFWVVDNFLKRKVLKSSHPHIHNNETAMQYLRAIDEVKYEQVEHVEESESDALLSVDEDADTRYKGLDQVRTEVLEQRGLLLKSAV